MKKKKFPYGLKLLIVMAVYALVFVCAGYFGFCWFWDYMDGYEASRPEVAIDAYMNALDSQHIQEHCQPLVDSIDRNLQSEEECYTVIDTALKSGFTCAKKVNECTDDTLVYMILSGGKTIGKVTMTAQQPDEHGFTPWKVTKEEFDLSFLMGQGTSITVPHNYPVYANGHPLNQEYVTESNIPYTLLKNYYDTYALPYKVTYTVPAILGDITLTATDPAGNPMTEDTLNQESVILNSCTPEQIAAVDSFIPQFLDRYVAYTANNGTDREGNYARLSKYLLKDSSLQERMLEALGGLKWVKDRNASVIKLDISSRIPTMDGHYLCTLSYTIKAAGKNDAAVEETYTVDLVLIETEDGLKAKTMYIE